LPEDCEPDSTVHVEYGEPQQYCMEGGIERVESAAGTFRIWFTEAGSHEMAGVRSIEVDYDDAAEGVRDLLDALDYIFHGFDGYRNAAAAPNGGPATQLGNSGVTEGPPSVS